MNDLQKTIEEAFEERAEITAYMEELQDNTGMRGELDPGYEKAWVDRERADMLSLRNAEKSFRVFSAGYGTLSPFYAALERNPVGCF